MNNTAGKGAKPAAAMLLRRHLIRTKARPTWPKRVRARQQLRILANPNRGETPPSGAVSSVRLRRRLNYVSFCSKALELASSARDRPMSLLERVDKKKAALAAAGALASVAIASYAISNPNTRHLCKQDTESTPVFSAPQFFPFWGCLLS